MNLSRNKLIGLAAIAGCSSYGFWHHRRSKNRLEFLALDPSEAVQNLNDHQLVGVSIRSLEALYHLNAHKCEEVTTNLNKAAWTHLCIYGSILCRFLLKDLKHIDEKTIMQNEKELNTFLQGMDLDDKKWLKALRWFSLNVCREDDLRCQDSPAEHRPSKMKRLHNLLQVLLYKSEHENCERLVAEQVPLLLFNLLHTYRDEKNKNLIITILKIMSNIARCSEECASSIANSAWLSLLAEMIVQPVLSEEPVLAHKILANMLFSFGASNYQLPSLVYELHRPDPDKEPLMDVVFIHGFRGSLFRTWRQRDNPEHSTTVRFWPREWLPREFHNESIRIIGIDYASKLLQFGELVDSVEERSKKIITALESAGVGARPVVFCVHSMGGLITKEMLTRDEELLDKTVGILFMGTPHKGTPVISAYLNYLRPSHDTKLLRVESELNKELHARFMERACDKIPLIVSLVEVRKSPLFGAKKIIVSPESSTFDKGVVYHIDDHHYNLCKPESILATNYCVIVNFLKDCIKLVKQNS